MAHYVAYYACTCTQLGQCTNAQTGEDQLCGTCRLIAKGADLVHLRFGGDGPLDPWPHRCSYTPTFTRLEPSA